MHTWTEVFGFTNLDDSLKQELKSMNMLVFPGIDMLQKQLLEQENIGGNKISSTGFSQMHFVDFALKFMFISWYLTLHFFQ